MQGRAVYCHAARSAHQRIGRQERSVPSRYRALLRNRDFALLIGGQTVSRIGDGLQVVALLWLALEIGGTRAVTLTALAGSAPVFVFGLLGGVYADRWNRRWALIVTDVVRGMAVLLIRIAAATGGIHLWHLLAVAALLAIFGTLAEPAGTALIPAWSSVTTSPRRTR